MAGTRGGAGRIVAMAIGVVVCLCLWLAGEARGARYTVVNCEAGAGWDADWADRSVTGVFRPGFACTGDSGDHMVSFSTGGGTVDGGRFARWRWSAAPGTGVTKVTGVWWHVLHDGMAQMIGPFDAAGNWVPGVATSFTDLTQRRFELDFPVPAAGVEDRLICARPADSWCSLAEGSASGIRDVAIEVEDDHAPGAGMAGELLEPRWHRGVEGLVVSGSDLGSGVRDGETLIDGVRAGVSEYWCAASYLGGRRVAVWMKPCLSLVNDREEIDTAKVPDGHHRVIHCAHDFSGAAGCTDPVEIGIDNSPPAGPRVTVVGGDGWRRTNAFDVGWAAPDQGDASPVVGARRRVTGPGTYDSGPVDAPGAASGTLSGVSVPGPGEWHLRLWLRDAAGNESEATATDVPLRFDDEAPSVAFAPGAPGGVVSAAVADPLSGPGGGTISLRRADSSGGWTALPTSLHGEGPGKAELRASLPDLAAGTWALRVEATDGAGNAAATTRRADGSEMTVTGPLPGGAAGGAGPAGRAGGDGGRGADGKGGRGGKNHGHGVEGASGGARTRLLVGLRGRRGVARRILTIPYGATAHLTGRLSGGAGKGLVGERVRVVVRPARGGSGGPIVRRLRTGRGGAFAMPLPPGPSRRIVVTFGGAAGVAPTRGRSLELRVRAGLTLAAHPSELRTGEEVHFEGRVRARGAQVPRRGKLVAIQYLERAGHRWRPALVIRSRPDGRFTAAYRFRYITGAARIHLRATALPEAGWPYAAGSSKPVTLEVHG